MKRSKHSLSHYKEMTFDMGELVPIGCVEVLPGDTFQHATSMFVRLSPLLAPVMHPISVRVHHWFVPNRLIWDDFEAFITGGPDGTDASVYPTVTLKDDDGPPHSADVGNLADYLGCPTGVDDLEVSALPFRAYAKIYNEWYRDQDLVTALTIDTTSGPDTTTNKDLQNIAWEKDYFTSARGDTQKGGDVTIPLSGDAPVTGIGRSDQSYGTQSQNVYETDGSGTVNYADASTAGSSFYIEEDPNNAGFPNIRADLAAATGIDVNDLRNYLAMQRYKEARQRYGSRYTEYLAYLKIRSSDARLQRPEYLGGGKQTLQISEVLQTAGTNDGSAVGVADLKGHGIGALRSNRYRRFFEEHGYVITLASVRPKTMYADGLDKHWNRRTKEDFWQKELQHIGQDEILNKELYAAHTTPEGVFGYQDRYDDYRRIPSKIAGEFRESGLNFWHMARLFSSDPALNETFITCSPTKRIHAVTSKDVLWVMANHSIQARRLVAKMGTSHIF